MARQVVVLGLGRFGATVATTLTQHGHEVLGIDEDRERVDALGDHLTHVVQADVADEDAMRDLGIEDFDVGVVAIARNIEASVLATMLLKRLRVRRVIARAATTLHEEILFRIGADRVVLPEREMGVQVAHTVGAPQVEDYLGVTQGYGLSRLYLPDSFAGQALADLDLPRRTGLMVVLLLRGDEVTITPPPTLRVMVNDQVVVAGPVTALERLSALLASA
jgi:trk system potassium uptake protein TrkA